MSVKNETRMTQEEFVLAQEIGADSGLPSTPHTLGDLLALAIVDVTLGAARDQLALAILERSSARAPGSLRELDESRRAHPEQLRGVDAALAAQGLSVNSSFIAEPVARLSAVRLLIDTAAGLAAQHYSAFGFGSPWQVSEGPPTRIGQWRIKADLRRYGGNVDTSTQFRVWLDRAEPGLSARIEIEANGFETTFWASSKAEITALRNAFDTFARATFLRPVGK